MWRSVASVTLAAVAATVMVAAPSSAEPVASQLTCAAPSGPNYDVTVDLAVEGLADGATTPVQIQIRRSGDVDYFDEVNAGEALHYVAEDVISHAQITDVIVVSVTVGAQVQTCRLNWSALAIAPLTLPDVVASGQQATVSGHVDTALNLGAYTAELQYKSSGDWIKLGSGAFDSEGNVEFSPAASRWKTVRMAICKDSDCARPVGASAEAIFNVSVPKATITSKPTSVLQGNSFSVSVAYGEYRTTGTASLQYKKSTGVWTTVSTQPLSHGRATMAFKPWATTPYRVVITPTGGATVYSSTFSVTYLKRLTLSAPKSVKKNTTVTFTLTQRLAPPYYAYLERLSGSKWVRVKTFVVGNTVQKTTLKVPSSGKYRVTASGYISNTVAITAK